MEAIVDVHAYIMFFLVAIVMFVFTALACVVYDFWWKDEPEETRRDSLVDLKFFSSRGWAFLVVVTSLVVGGLLPVGVFLVVKLVGYLLRRGWWWPALGVGLLGLLARTFWVDFSGWFFLLGGLALAVRVGLFSSWGGVLLAGLPVISGDPDEGADPDDEEAIQRLEGFLWGLIIGGSIILVGGWLYWYLCTGEGPSREAIQHAQRVPPQGDLPVREVTPPQGPSTPSSSQANSVKQLARWLFNRGIRI
jgi:hypothetical protein